MQDMADKILRDVQQGSQLTDRQQPYPFSTMGAEIAAALIQAAEAQVEEANNLLASAKVVAEGIKAQIDEQTKLVSDMNDRLRTFGQTILDAHRKLTNGK